MQAHAERFRKITTDWDIVERQLKQAELLQGEVVIAAVNELRYAGRRLADAHHYGTVDPEVIGKTEDELSALVVVALTDTEQYCQRAHHDAVDSQIFFLGGYIDLLEARVGPETLVVAIPHYLQKRRVLQDISKIIVESRGDRQNRASYYQQVAEDLLPDLLDLYWTLKSSEAIVFKMKRRGQIMFWSGIAGWALAIPSMYIAVSQFYRWFPFGP